MTTFITENEAQTIELAKTLTNYLKPGMTLLLEGDLGAGKTTFSKGIGEGLGIKRIIKSPSYTIIREYQEGEYPLYHIDLYRLEEGEVSDLGLEEYFDGSGITLVEWASIAPEDMPEERLEIKLAVSADNINQRTIQFHPQGEQYEKIVEQLSKQLLDD